VTCKAEFGLDGQRSDTLVARVGCGMGFQPSSDADNGTFDLRRNAVDHRLGCARQIEQAIWPLGHIATPPFVEPHLGMLQTLTNGFHRFARQTPLNGQLAIGQFVVHNCLQG
jgi:hypothetical protein